MVVVAATHDDGHGQHEASNQSRVQSDCTIFLAARLGIVQDQDTSKRKRNKQSGQILEVVRVVETRGGRRDGDPRPQPPIFSTYPLEHSPSLVPRARCQPFLPLVLWTRSQPT